MSKKLAEHILGMQDDSHFSGHPEWNEIVKDAKEVMTPTAGEWIASKYSHDWGVYSSEGNGNDIAIVRGDSAQAEANAKLIAAAPKLLSALKTSLDELLIWQRTYIEDTDVADVIREAEDAIRLATED